MEIKPLTVVIGANNSGKSSLIEPLLMMKQTLESAEDKISLMTKGPLVNAGSYRDFIYNHDTNKPLMFDVRTHFHPDLDENEKYEIGKRPPGEFASYFEYRNQLIPNDLELTRYLVKDVHGKLMLSRLKRTRRKFSLNFRPRGTFRSEVRDQILDDVPKHFFFTDEPVHKILRDRARKDSGEKKELEFLEGEFLYFASVSEMTREIEDFFGNISYLGPLREPFRRLYEFSGETPQNIGVRGENTPEIIARGITPKQKKWIGKWTQRFDFGGKLQTHINNESNTFYLELKKSGKSSFENLFDTGTGLSQVLPLIVEGMRTPKESMIICEQPEIHLNPRLQVLLGDLFVEIANLGKNVVIETHSEHLILRLRRLVAEGAIDSESVALLFVEKRGKNSRVREIPIQKNGHIKDSDWPIGFFGESLREAIDLAFKQSVGKKN